MNSQTPEKRDIVLTQPSHLVTNHAHPANTQLAMHAPSAYQSTAYAPIQRTVFSIEEIVDYIRKFWILSLLVGLAVGIGLFTYVQSRKPVYQSTAVVLLNNTPGSQLNLQSMKSDKQSEYNLPQLVNNLSIEIESDKFRLSFYEAISEELRAHIIGDVSPEEEGYAEGNLFLDRLEGMISIDILKDSHMVSVTAKHRDKDAAANIANSYVNYFSKYAKDQKLEMTRKVVDFLGGKADELLERVQKQEEELLEYRRQEGIVSLQSGSDFVASKITVLNTELVDARLLEERLTEVIEAVKSLADDPEDILKVPTFAENSTLEKAYSSLAQSRANVAVLAADFGAKHPTMIIAVSQQDSAYDNLSKLVEQSVESQKRQLTLATAKVKSLEIKVTQGKEEMMLEGNKIVSLQLKEQQLKLARDLYSSLIQQMNEASISLQFAGVDHVRVTEKATARREQVFPNKSLSAVLGSVAFAGCFFGIPLTLGFGQRLLTLGKEESDSAGNGSGRQLDTATSRAIPPGSQLSHNLPHGEFSTLVTFPASDESESRTWVESVTDLATQSGADLNRFVNRSLRTDAPPRGFVVTSEKSNSAKSLAAAAVCLSASRQGLSTLFVSAENLVFYIGPQLRKESLDQSGGRQLPSTEELLAPFATTQKDIHCITDEAWKRDPSLCLKALCNAHYCVDLLVIDAPVMTDEASLKIASSFAAKAIFVRGKSETPNYQKIQSALRRILPDCPVAGEFVISE